MIPEEKTTVKENGRDVEVTKHDLSKFQGCRHKLYREGIRVKCRCGLMYLDPEKKFPIEEFNAQYQQKG